MGYLIKQQIKQQTNKKGPGQDFLNVNKSLLNL